jgi:hypothetical protein
MTQNPTQCQACDSFLRPGARYCVCCGRATTVMEGAHIRHTPRSGDMIALAARRQALAVPGCKRCGWPLRAGARFCGACGMPVAIPLIGADGHRRAGA